MYAVIIDSKRINNEGKYDRKRKFEYPIDEKEVYEWLGFEPSEQCFADDYMIWEWDAPFDAGDYDIDLFNTACEAWSDLLDRARLWDGTKAGKPWRQSIDSTYIDDTTIIGECEDRLSITEHYNGEINIREYEVWIYCVDTYTVCDSYGMYEIGKAYFVEECGMLPPEHLCEHIDFETIGVEYVEDNYIKLSRHYYMEIK